jgi:hypothetical protein
VSCPWLTLVLVPMAPNSSCVPSRLHGNELFIIGWTVSMSSLVTLLKEWTLLPKLNPLDLNPVVLPRRLSFPSLDNCNQSIKIRTRLGLKSFLFCKHSYTQDLYTWQSDCKAAKKKLYIQYYLEKYDHL